MRNFLLGCFAVLAAPFAMARNRLHDFIERRDPLNTRELYFSHVRRAWHQGGLRLASALAVVAISLLPGVAHAAVWNPETNKVFGFATGATGVLAWAPFAGAQQSLAPFRYGTVKRRIPIGTFAITLGTRLPSVKIPQVGMASRVLFTVAGSYTVATAPLVVANTDGFDSLIANASLTLNNGSAQVVSTSGIGINVINRNIGTALPIKKGSPAGTGNVNLQSLPLALGASTFTYGGILPINANQGMEFEMGLVNLQAQEVQMTVDLTFNPLATIFTTPANCTAFAATCALSYEYFEIPDPSQYLMPPLMLVRTIEDGAAAIAATGDQLYTLTRLGTMLSYHAVLVLNNLYGDAGVAISETKLRFNKTDVQYDQLSADTDIYESELYGYGVDLTQSPTPSAATPGNRRRLFQSAVTLNFWSAGDADRNGGDFRDAIDTEENTTSEFINTIAAGTALNAGKDFLIHVRRVAQRLIPA